MAGLDWAILAAFLLYVIAVGLKERARASRSLDEYFLAGRSLSGWSAGISMAATQFAADTPLVVTGIIATAGVFGLWRMWIYALAFLLLGFVLARSWRRAGVITDAELTELRYGSRAAAGLRAVKAIYFGTVFNCTVLAMVLLAASRIAEPFLVWHAWLPADWHGALAAAMAHLNIVLTANVHDPDVWVKSADNLISIGAIVATTLLYSTTGGLRAVVSTDIVQFTLAMLATLIFAIVVVHHVGGLAGLAHGIKASFGANNAFVQAGLSPTAPQIVAFTPGAARDAGLMVLSVYAIQWIAQMNADGTGYLAQRCLACRSDRDARIATIVFTYSQILVRSLLWLPIGLGLLLVFRPEILPATQDAYARSREATYALGIAALLPPGLKGLMVVGMLAALTSTIDTHLNWGSSYWTNDLYRRFLRQGPDREPDARSLVRVARISGGLILLLALGVMTQLGSIQQAWRISLLLGAGMGVMLVLRWLWWRISAWGELSSIAVSLLLAPALLHFVNAGMTLSAAGADALRLLLITLGATTTGVVVSLLTPEDPARLVAFYRRADPPGASCRDGGVRSHAPAASIRTTVCGDCGADCLARPRPLRACSACWSGSVPG